MANFQVTHSVTVTTTDGISLSKTISALGLNAKELLDDVFGPGPVAVDLAPLVSSITKPRAVLLLCDGDGAKLKFDGAAGFTSKAFKQVFLEVADAVGALDLEIEVQGAAQRIRFLALGDPD